MSDFAAHTDADLSALDADLDQLGSKLDDAKAHELTQAQVDKLDALKAKAEALINDPTSPTPGATDSSTAADGTAPSDTSDGTTSEDGSSTDAGTTSIEGNTITGPGGIDLDGTSAPTPDTGTGADTTADTSSTTDEPSADQQAGL